ncbi:DUF2779 domain-containing protein [Williamsoniiplasma lucivorax]|uniref:DUF2779 domain-containing protein n=1 Tax=Williamsoniiplasma lucivorax TaxID=209274 RepID=A0A2S5RD10_9MOLU|nr:DUF2779 domain-containing protein [Williamsoniiplasma lucivorax]PPE05213.1 hypothetical protein ELUCI_v1c07490 [Williamsoniiplasma lucivorax]
MEKIYKTNLSKEDFKMALTECGKSAWIWHSLDNFKIAIQFKQEEKFEYVGQGAMEIDEEFYGETKPIDLFQVYELAHKTKRTSEEDELLEHFNQAWTDENGFDLLKFAGEQIEDGNAIGNAAKDLYMQINAKENGGQKLTEDFSELSFVAAEVATKKLIDQAYDQYAYLFEPAFSYDQNNFKVRCDVLKLKPNKHVEIIEFKGVSEVKDPHFFDLVYQAWVLEKLGFIVDNLFLGHISKSYIRGVENPDGWSFSDLVKEWEAGIEPIAFAEAKAIVDQMEMIQTTPEDNLILDKSEYSHFLNIAEEYKKGVRFFDLYQQLKANDQLDFLMVQLTNLMAYNAEQINAYFQKDECELLMKFDQKNQQFQYASLMNKNVSCYHALPWFDKARETVFNFTGSPAFANVHKAYVYRQTSLVYLDDIPSLNQLDHQLRKTPDKPFFQPQHHTHFDVYKKWAANPSLFDETQIITNRLQLADELNIYENYPVVMYDFETVKWAIPRFNKINSYYQTPFQYSMHTLVDDKYDYENPQTMEHKEFLANLQADPRPEFAYRFLKDIFSYGPGVYVAYNQAFEKMVLKRMAYLFPEIAKPLMYIVQNTVDLMNFFKGSKKDGRDWYLVYHPLFNGSYSIKKTQPALEPNVSYKDLTINRGDKASQTFREFVDGYIDVKTWQTKIFPDMLAYCGRDTLAMVVILQRVKAIYERMLINEKI